MPKKSLFANSQQLGSFGEFCYQKFALQKFLSIEKVGILEYDFNVGTHKVDVKTTESHVSKYAGKRVREDISYDVVGVTNDTVSIYPDLNSPLIKYYGASIGDIKILYEEWLIQKSNKANGPKRDNTHQAKRKLIKSSIEAIFPSKKIRVIFRGSVSETRWSSSPDNIPGSRKSIQANDLTVFVQMFTSGAVETISRIYLFNHSLLDKFKKNDPDSRQIKKGVSQVIDFEWFNKNHQEFIFESLDALEVFVKKN